MMPDYKFINIYGYWIYACVCALIILLNNKKYCENLPINEYCVCVFIIFPSGRALNSDILLLGGGGVCMERGGNSIIIIEI